jgi:signal transduction histidine kinase
VLDSQSRTDGEPPQSAEARSTSIAQQSQLRLVDSMLHDARNPLNAISIHVEILGEKLRQARAAVNVDSNLQAIRSQLLAVDEILKSYANFIHPRQRGEGQFSVSQVVQDAVKLLGYESRRKNVEISTALEPSLSARSLNCSAVPSLMLTLLLRSLDRAPSGSKFEVSVVTENGDVVVVVSQTGPDLERGSHDSALEALCGQCGGRLVRREGASGVAFPGIQPS